MFIIELTYTKPLEVVDQHLISHREFLDQYYANGTFIASGPQIPRTGGVIIAQAKNEAELQKIIEQDPFYINDIAEYRVIEFDAVKKQDWLAKHL